ncbi:MAG: HNH endonuclease [Thermoproteota archaeon]
MAQQVCRRSRHFRAHAVRSAKERRQRKGASCVECKKEVKALQVDHIIPRSKSGLTLQRTSFIS